jgi:uncharacterized protein (DUF433 family)
MPPIEKFHPLVDAGKMPDIHRYDWFMTEIDWSECPIVERNPKKLGGVPTVRNFRLAADTVVENHDDGLADDEIAYQFSLPIEDVRSILAYAEQSRLTRANLSR